MPGTHNNPLHRTNDRARKETVSYRARLGGLEALLELTETRVGAQAVKFWERQIRQVIFRSLSSHASAASFSPNLA